MDNQDKQNVKYRAQGARNGMEVLITGAIGLIFIMGFNLLRPGEISIIEIFLVSVCIAGCFCWFFKNSRTFL